MICFLIFFYAILTGVEQAVLIESQENAQVALKAPSLGNNSQNKKNINRNLEENDLDSVLSKENVVSRDFEDNIDSMAEESNGDGSILDAFQQYVKYGSYNTPYVPPVAAYPPVPPYPPVAAYPPVPPYPPVAAYPPVGAYPSVGAYPPIYQGYFVTTPATTARTTTAATTTTTTTSSPLSNILAGLNPLTFFTGSNIIFRVFAGILSFFGMFIFSGALGDIICNITPLCNMAYNTITVLMEDGYRSHGE